MLLLVVGESDFEDDMLLLSAGESDFEGVEADGKGEVEGVQVDGEGDAEGGEADGEGDVERDQLLEKIMEWFGSSIDGMDNVATVVSEEEDGNETEVYDSDEHGSLVRSDKDEEHEDGERRISNLGMLFKDSKQFKSVIRNYFKECRRQLKFLKNELKRVVRILASYNPVAKCLQIMNFQKEHHCLVSFKNKMVIATMIAQHFEAIIKDHPKMKLREIQRTIQMVTTNSASYFKRFYVCFDTLKRGWKVSPFKSEFLATVGRDVNNQMFPIAWAMVEVECTDS
ncbi:hypothetical protein ES319_D06G085000v1 [Gossypium barbadense]|uniref:Uncharacterized protein n=1 Tax=Gossypium barbadense TaxID=3634 RepID=A0A5J5QZ93_GOSBA|nr:hypothetical protein ES319_D06G085000v1 [Gossypium barbadense]